MSTSRGLYLGSADEEIPRQPLSQSAIDNIYKTQTPRG